MKEYTFIIFIFIWISLILRNFLTRKKSENFLILLKNKEFTITCDKIFYSTNLINICFILFYIGFGFTELKLEYFILHLLIFIITTIKFKKNDNATD